LVMPCNGGMVAYFMSGGNCFFSCPSPQPSPILTPPPLSTSGEGSKLLPPLWGGMGRGWGEGVRFYPRPLGKEGNQSLPSPPKGERARVRGRSDNAPCNILCRGDYPSPQPSPRRGREQSGVFPSPQMGERARVGGQ
jgi:hypothetical protein